VKTVLVVDDEPKIVDVVREYLEHAGFAVRTAGDGPAALERARALAPGLIALLITGRRRAYWGGPYGPCGPGGKQAMLADWHRQAHAEPTAAPPGEA